MQNTSDQDFPSLDNLTQSLNEGISVLSSEALEEESHFDVDDDEGILLVWGCGEFGQHGHGHQNDVPINTGTTNPLLIGNDGLVSLVACGSSHTVIVTGQLTRPSK
jgi:alpha-tubulin suppressor-like RCC1 family protein